jgi:hypothetical protein
VPWRSPCVASALPVRISWKALHSHGADSGGGGARGGRGGGIAPQRGPQSAQSVAYGQSENAAPGPPSSHTPSELCTSRPAVPGRRHVSKHVQPGGSGYGGARRGSSGGAGGGRGGVFGGGGGEGEGGGGGGGGGVEGQPELIVSAPVIHCVPDHQTQVGTSFGQDTDVVTDTIDDQSVPGAGPTCQRPPATFMYHM